MSAAKKKLYDDAVQYVMDNFAEGDRVHILEKTIPGSKKAKAETIVDAYIVDLYDSITPGKGKSPRFVTGSGLIGALDSKVLSGRKDIPAPFRKLLGEVENVSFNYVNTVHRLAGYVADLSFQKVLRADLLEAGLAHEGNQRTGETKLAPGAAFDGLDGLYVDPIFKSMYESMMPLTSSSNGGMEVSC